MRPTTIVIFLTVTLVVLICYAEAKKSSRELSTNKDSSATSRIPGNVSPDLKTKRGRKKARIAAKLAKLQRSSDPKKIAEWKQKRAEKIAERKRKQAEEEMKKMGITKA
ncbi:Hypothetical predicted protein [Cloeon dipterum]|uniref:Uncharacterized protein n=1 Tax=Cloeon dipterum TaxID=197152 RepID=A0A8S1DWC2_9INSE|nr:Hypothetical predicted protein [Cloeon dipterum]